MVTVSRRVEVIIRAMGVVPCVVLVGAVATIYGPTPIPALSLVASLLFALHAAAMLVVTNAPGSKLWSPPRKILPFFGYFVAVVAAILTLALHRIGLFVFYGALTLLAGEQIIAAIELFRQGRTPTPIVTALGWALLLVANALFVFSLPPEPDTVAAGLALSGAFLVLAGYVLRLADFFVAGAENQVPVTVLPSFDHEDIVEDF